MAILNERFAALHGYHFISNCELKYNLGWLYANLTRKI